MNLKLLMLELKTFRAIISVDDIPVEIVDDLNDVSDVDVT